MLGKRLARVRKERGYTQQGMADILSITVGQYQKYENGISKPTVEKLVAIADTLNVSTDYLLCRDEFLSGMTKQTGTPPQKTEP